MPDTISVKLDTGRTAELGVEERVYADRTCGQWESGWRCWDETTDMEYFISDTGEVWIQPANLVVGVAPVIRKAADDMDHLMEFGWHRDDREHGIPAGYENDLALD